MVRAEQTGDFATMLSAATVAGRATQSANERRDVQRAVAYALVGLGEYEEAVKHVEAVASSEGSSPWLTQLYNNVAVRLLKSDQQRAAERLLMLAYESSRPDERDLGLLGNLSSLAKSQGRIEDAIRYQTERMQLTKDPASIPAIEFAIAGNLLQLERFDEARARYQAVLDSPESSDDLARLKGLAAENIRNITALTTPKFAPSEIRPEPSRSTSWRWAIVAGSIAVLIVVGGAVAWKRHRMKTR
jgi:tetratricopeptide (TPR) repeat protein